jgi:hypothetical protein
MNCRIKALNDKQKYKFTIEIDNKSGTDLILVSYFKEIKYDSISILKNKTFKKDIIYTSNPSNNYQIWSDNLNGSRNKVIINWDDKKSLNTENNSKFKWLYINHATKKPRRGFSWYNPDTNTWNYGTFKYCITKEDYDKAEPV